MSDRRSNPIVAVAASLVMLVACALVDAAAPRYAEVFIDASVEARSQLNDLDAAVAAGQWSRVNFLADQLTRPRSGGDDLVEIAPGRYIPITHALAARAAHNPTLADDLAARYEPFAAAALDQAAMRVGALSATFDQWSFTKSGQLAALRAAGLLLERADFTDAAHLLESLTAAPALGDRAAQAHELAAVAAIYQRDLVALRRHAVALQHLHHGDRLDALTNLARRIHTTVTDTDTADDPAHRNWRLGFDTPTNPTSNPQKLVCTDRPRGDARWTIRPSDLSAQWHKACWAGRPLTRGDRVYIPLRIDGPANLQRLLIVALNLDDGSLLWSHPFAAQAPTQLRRHRIPGTTPPPPVCDLAVGPAGIFAALNDDALAAFDPDTGAPRWIITPQSSRGPRSPEAPDQPDHTSRTAINTPDLRRSTWTRQRLALTPAGLIALGIAPDSDAVTLINPADGSVLRRIPAADWDHPMHLRPGPRDLLTFGDHIDRIDGRTLTPLWRSRESFDPASFNPHFDPAPGADGQPIRTRSTPAAVRVDSAPLNTRVDSHRLP